MPGVNYPDTRAGRDFEREGATGTHRGSGPFIHADPTDRPPAKFSGELVIHSGPGRESYLLLPVINGKNMIQTIN